MTVRPTSLAALAAGLLLAAVPGSAAADRTVVAKVVAPAVPHGKAAALPVLLPRAAARAYRRPVIAAIVRGRRPVRWGGDRLALQRLRPGDRLTLRLRGTRVRGVRLYNSGSGDDFDRVFGQLVRTANASRETVRALEPIVARSGGDAEAARDQLVTFEGILQILSDDIDLSVRKLAEQRPRKAPRRSRAVAAAQRPYATQLAAVRDQARVVTDRLRAARDALASGPAIGESGDGTVVPPGTSPPPVLPLEGPEPIFHALDEAVIATNTLLDALGAVEAVDALAPLLSGTR